jgi:predicted DsbA family dithiol-disulfide isomerase
MPDGSREIVLYHSVICPRCALSKLALGRVLRKYPEIKLTKIEFLTNIARARQDGVRSIPTLVAGKKSLGGVLLTPSAIERFIESLS